MKRVPVTFVLFLNFAVAPAWCTGNAPLDKVAILALLAGGTPAAEVGRYVEKAGINFPPDEGFFKLMRRAEQEEDPGKGQLQATLSAARQDSPAATPHPREADILEHLAHGAEVAAKLPPHPDAYRPVEIEFRQALELAPGNSYLHFALGNALGYQEKFDLAAQELREVLRAMPDLGIAHLQLGRILGASGDLKNSLAEFREGVAVDPTSPTTRGVLARALQANRDSDGAIAVLREGLRLQPNDPSLHNAIGTVLCQSGDMNSGIAEYWHAIRLGSKDPGLRADLANALRQKGDLDGAIEQLREAVRLDPDSYRRRHSLGVALVDKGDLPAAKVEYIEAIRLKPEFALSYSELGYVLKKQGDLDGAMKEYREAIRLDPNLAVAHQNLAAALFAKGQHDAAYEEVLTAYQLSPDDRSISEQFKRLPDSYKQRASQPAREFKPPKAPLGEPETANFVFFMDLQGPSLVPLEAETPTLGTKCNALGIGGQTGYISVTGERSPVRMKSVPQWQFVIRPSSPDLRLNFQFEKFEPKDGSRTLTWKKKLEPSRSSTKPGLLIFDSDSFGKSSIRLSVPYALEPGEYGFFVSAKGGWKMFCFGVDAP